MSERTRTAVVTGGAGGIGWEIGKRLVGEGFRVIAADVVPGFTAEAGADPSILWRKLDVSDNEAVQREFGAIAEEFGGIDVLVNNAGIQRHGGIEELSWADWQAVINVNLHGVFNCLQAAGQIMLEGEGGAIVNIASVSARGAAGRSPYAAAKAAVVSLTATAGAEWAARGVRVNAIAPGYIETGIFIKAVEDGTLDLDTILARIPAGRLAKVAEIADVVSFLVSDQAGYINGQTLYVDGGFVVDYGIPLAKKPS